MKKPSVNSGSENRMIGELPRESMDALIHSIKETVREYTGLEISAEQEIQRFPSTGTLLMQVVVTLPAGITPQQRAEADYWIREIGVLYRYADEPVA